MNILMKILLIMLLFSFRPATAQEIEVGAGLWCDTSEQVSRFLTIVDGDSLAALKQVNDEAKNEYACLVGQIAFYRGKTEKKISNHDGIWDVLPILIVGIGTPAGFVQVNPKVFYTAILTKDREI